MLKLLIFDMDGTTCDTDLLLTLTWLELYKKFKPGYIPHLDTIVTFSGPPIKESLRGEFPDVSLETSLPLFQKISRSYYDEYVDSYPGEVEALKQLKKIGYKLAINTNKQHDFAVYVLKLLKLEDDFEVVVGGGDTKESKPSPEGVYKILSHFPDIKKEETLYIGDSFYDILTAKNAGVKSMLVTWGPRKIDPTLHPDYFLENYGELVEKLKSL